MEVDTTIGRKSEAQPEKQRFPGRRFSPTQSDQHLGCHGGTLILATSPLAHSKEETAQARQLLQRSMTGLPTCRLWILKLFDIDAERYNMIDLIIRPCGCMRCAMLKGKTYCQPEESSRERSLKAANFVPPLAFPGWHHARTQDTVNLFTVQMRLMQVMIDQTSLLSTLPESSEVCGSCRQDSAARKNE